MAEQPISQEAVEAEPQKLATQRTLTSDELLRLMSRSFYKPIELLETARGPDEANKREATRCAYNILRECDTIEDGTLEIEEKNWALDKLGFTVSQVEKSNGEGIEDIIHGTELRAITQCALKGIRTEDERIFVEHFGRGPVLEEMHSFKRPIRSAINYCTGRMITGMEEFIQKGPIQTTKRLQDYCFYVAGSVGASLNNIVAEMDGIELNQERAEDFGTYLQLVNILKGVYRDWKEGRVYLPAELHPNEAHEFLMQGRGPDAEQLRKEVLDKMLDITDKNFKPAAIYVASIPNQLPGYQTFCLLPFIGAQQTLQVIREAIPGEVFAGREEAIKVPDGTFANIGRFLMQSRAINTERISNWLSAYQEKPENFSFKPGKYDIWSINWLKD